MALPASKSSSSSLASASRSNPNLRNSEVSNPMRRSFSGNPFPKPSIIANPRSFNPNTPANSPSDFPRRNSIGGRENIGSFRDLDDKENGKDHLPRSAKVRSPASSTTKSTKNFMSPTISASSKIAESPRKKVLVERNEPARTSFSSTEGKSPARKVTFAEAIEYSDSRPESGLEEKKLQPLFDGVTEEETENLRVSMVSKDLKGEALDLKTEKEEFSFETVTDEPDCVNLDPTFKLSPTPPPVSSTSTIIAPLDADPLIRPYDPKMNYLSPRPQFLHYKPNPRVELYKERECMKLEDSFSSDTEVTEEALSDGSEKESEDVSSDEKLSSSFSMKSEKESEVVSSDTEAGLSIRSEKESEDVSSDEIVSEEKGHASEDCEPIATTSTLIPEEESVEAKVVAKAGFSMRSKSIIALLLLLLAACVSVSFSNSPVFDSTSFKDLTTFYQTYDSSEVLEFARDNFDRFSELAKENFDGLARNFHIWFTKSMTSISKLISSFRGGHNLGRLHYWNLTHLQENIEVSQLPIFGHGEKLIGLQVETPVFEENDDPTETYTEEIVGDIPIEHSVHHDSAYEEQEVQEEEPSLPIQDVEENDASKEEDVTDISADKEGEQVQQDMRVITEVETVSDASEESEEVIEPNHSESNIDDSVIVSETSEIHTEVSEASNLEAKQAPENEASVNVNLKDQTDMNSEVDETEHIDDQPDDLNSEIQTEVCNDIPLIAEGKSPSVESVIVASLLLLLTIIAGTAFKLFRKKDEGGRTMATTTTVSVDQPHLAEAKTIDVDPKVEAPLEKSSYSLRNDPTEMDDVVGESCPSEVSTFWRSSSSYSQKAVKVKEQNEAQSIEKKPRKNYRRESLASSDYSMGGGSSSYGSFTTYEKLSSKHGHGDAETVTPVRRSSRFKNLATSPL